MITDNDLEILLPGSSESSCTPSKSSSPDTDSKSRHSTIVFLVSLEHDPKAQYNWRASVSQPGFTLMAYRLGMHDAAVQNMFGRPDYWSAFGHELRQQNGAHERQGYEFFCQHPRWSQKTRHDKTHHCAPCSVYLHHDDSTNTSRYVVSSSGDDASIRRLLSDLGVDPEEENSLCSEKEWKKPPLAAAASPFLVHGMMSSYTYEQSKDFLQDVRERLFSQIAAVNDYSTDRGRSNKSNDSGRLQLRSITQEMHLVSQTCDSGIANAEMSISLCKEMLRVYEDLCPPPLLKSAEGWGQVHDSMKWVLRTWYCQKEWLTSYKARKDTAMNFVYNLVTQQDNALNIDMAKQATQYSSSMHAITILTMVFLPGTFVAGVFGSGILDKETKHGTSDLLRPFIYLCIPLTFLSLASWYFRRYLGSIKVFFIGCRPRKTNVEEGEKLGDST